MGNQSHKTKEFLTQILLVSPYSYPVLVLAQQVLVLAQQVPVLAQQVPVLVQLLVLV